MSVAAGLEMVLLDAGQNSSDSNQILPSELEMYSKNINLQCLSTQLKMLPDLIQTYNEKYPATTVKHVTHLRTLCEAMNDSTASRSMFSEVFRLLRIVLTIPVTIATTKRKFSAIRQLKTYLRSSTSHPRLNHVMPMHIYKERAGNIDVEDVAKGFITVNER